MNKRIPLYYVTTALFWFSLYAFVPVIPDYAEGLGASKTLIGLITGSYGFSQMILRIPLGIISDVLKKRKIFISIGICFTIAGTLGMFLFRDKYALLVCRAMTGIAASTWVIFIVLFTSYFQSEHSIKAVGFLNSVNAFGTMSAYLAGGIVSDALGVRYSFLLSASAAIIALILSAFILENKDIKKEPVKAQDILQVGKNRNLIFVSALAIVSQYLVFATTNSFTPMIAGSLGASDFQKGLLSMVSSLAGLIASTLAGTVLIRRFGARATVGFGFVLASACYTAVPFERHLLVLFITQFIGAFGSGSVLTLLMGMSIRDISLEKRATAMGFFQAIYGVGMFFGPAIAGIIGDCFGLTPAYLITGVIGITGASAVFICGFGEKGKANHLTI